MAFEMRSADVPVFCWISRTSRQRSRDFAVQNSRSCCTLDCSMRMWFMTSGKAMRHAVRAHVLITTPPNARAFDDPVVDLTKSSWPI